MKKIYWLNLILLLVTINLKAQEPAISYRTFQFFELDSFQIIKPVNTGGRIPERNYSETTTFAGKGEPSFVDGKGNLAGFNFPSSIAIANDGTAYVTDEKNNSIRKITPDGVVTTLIKTGLSGPSGIAVDDKNNLYVVDCYHHKIKKISPAGIVTVIAGNGMPGNLDHQNGLKAMFRYPVGIAIDKKGNLFIADEGNNKIRKISPNGEVSTFAGDGVSGQTDDKNGKLARFNQPSGLAIDTLGNIYVADQLNHKIRKITANGSVSSFAGIGMAGATNNDLPLFTSFNNPRGIAIDRAGNIYIGDVGNQQIRKISYNGETSTLSGSGVAGSADHPKGKLANFFFPNGLAIGPKGQLFVADALNHKIRKVEIKGYQLMPDRLPDGLSFDNATGAFSGKPVSVNPGTNYVISAHNNRGSTSTQVNLAVSTQPGNALNFDGFDDHVVMLDKPSLTPKEVTVEMWVSLNKLAAYSRFILKRNDKRRFDDSYSMGLDSPGYFRAVVASGNGLRGSQVMVTSKEMPVTGQWYHLAMVFAKDSLSLFVNGQLQGKQKVGFPISIGNNELAFNFDKSLSFTADEVRIFSTDRSQQISADLYNLIKPDEPGLVAYYNFNEGIPNGLNLEHTKLYDLSSNGNDGILNNFSNSGNLSNWIESLAMVIPKMLVAKDLNEDRFLVSWLPSSIGKADFYLLDVAEDPMFFETLEGYKEKIITTTSEEILRLKSNTTYYVRVCAKKNNISSKGMYTPTLIVKTP